MKNNIPIYQIFLRRFRQKLQRKSKQTLFVQQLFFENHAVYEIIWKNMIGPDGPQMTM
jgi:hypothetical protein